MLTVDTGENRICLENVTRFVPIRKEREFITWDSTDATRQDLGWECGTV